MRTMAPIASRFDFVPVEMEADTVVSGELVVAIEVCGPVVGGHAYVEIAVSIEVGVAEAAADLRLAECFAGGCSDVLKFSLPIIEKNLRWLRVADVAANVADSIVNVSVGDNISPDSKITTSR